MKNETEKLKKVGICLPATVLDRLNKYVKAEDRSRSNVVARLLAEVLDENGVRRASSSEVA